MINKSRFIALLLGAGSLAALAACGDKSTRQEDITAPPTSVGAFVRFFNYSVGSPGVNFYANTQKVTAISTGSCYGVLPTDTATTNKCLSTGIESTSGTTYNTAANGALYAEIAPAQYAFAGEIAATTNHGLAISTVNMTVADQKFYSYYQTGVYNSSTKAADAFMVEDPIPAITDPTVAWVRLVNAMPGSSPLTLVAYDSTSKTQVAINSAVAYKTAGNFVTVPAGTWTLLTSGGGVANPSAGGVVFLAGHVYSVAARGDYTSSTDANKPGLTSTGNR